MNEITVKSTLDNSPEPCLFDCPANAVDVPLLVGLHTWVPITDLAVWLREKSPESRYGRGIQACCGGVPEDSPETAAEYSDRSPLMHTQTLRDVNLSVHHGRYDRSVPYTHTLRLAMEMEEISAPRFFFEIFDGGHELRYDTAFRWLESTLSNDNSRENNKLTG